MYAVLLLIASVSYVLFVMFSFVRRYEDEFSEWELRRRARHSQEYKVRVRRLELSASLEIIHKTLAALALVIASIVLIGLLGLLWGSVVTVLAVAALMLVRRLKTLTEWSSSLAARVDPRIIRLVERYPALFIAEEGRVKSKIKAHHKKIGSREELSEIITKANDVLSSSERHHVSAALALQQKTVKDAMTPRKKMKSIGKDEFLGPLVLDELHAAGHRYVPVVNDKDEVEVIGVVDLYSLLSLDVRNSLLAGDAMSRQVTRIPASDSLDSGFDAICAGHGVIGFVVDDNGSIIGITTISQLVDAMIGRSTSSADA